MSNEGFLMRRIRGSTLKDKGAAHRKTLYISFSASVRCLLQLPSRCPTSAVSANGTTNGTVWVLDATNVSNLLFSGPVIGSGAPGVAVKFKVPTVANGKVYVCGQLSFTAFGLPHAPAQALVPSRGPSQEEDSRDLKLKPVRDCRMFANLCAGSIRARP